MSAVSAAGNWNLLHTLSLLQKGVSIGSLRRVVSRVHMLFVKEIKVLVQFFII